MKHKCCKCSAYAVWKYMPDGERAEDLKFFCDDHVSRGCSCQINSVTNQPDLDDFDRLLPCVEYDFSETGYKVITLREHLQEVREDLQLLKEIYHDDSVEQINVLQECHDIFLSDIFLAEKLLEDSEWEISYDGKHNASLHCLTLESGIKIKEIMSLAENEISEEGYYFYLWQNIVFFFDREHCSIFFENNDNLLFFIERFKIKVSGWKSAIKLFLLKKKWKLTF